MIDTIEQTHRQAELAIGTIKKLGLRANPKNIEIWMLHVGGKNPALSAGIQKLFRQSDAIAQPDLDGLYNLHVRRTDLTSNVIELASKFEIELNTLTDFIESSGENAHDQNQDLDDISQSLAEPMDHPKSVSDLLQRAIKITKNIREENSTLEKRLIESSGEVAALRRNVQNIQQEAMLDPLTGIKNRKTFDLEIESQLKKFKAGESSVSLIMADIDFFKSFNDNWGHQTGDQVLRLVAEVMGANVKGQDMLARYGGEEFAILLPDTSLEHAAMLADRIRIAVQERRLKKRRTGEDLGTITMSMGVALIAKSDTSNTLIERADQCLYLAKEHGRNQVIHEQKLSVDVHKRTNSG